MSSDEAYQKKYNIQPNPYKGAQASVLARFGKQAQNLAGTSGKGPAVSAVSQGKAGDTAKGAVRDSAGQKAMMDSQSRLMRISSEMDRDSIRAKKEISDAQFEQQNNVPLIDQIASGLTLAQSMAGLARGIGHAAGDESNTELDQERYQENYDFNIDRLMKVEGVETPEELTREALQEAHNIGLAAAKPKTGGIFRKAGRVFGDVVGGGIEAIPVVGSGVRRLRNQNLAEAEKIRSVEKKTMTPDMADKYYGEIAEHLSNMKDVYNRPLRINPEFEKIMFESFTDLVEMMELGMINYDFYSADSLNFPIDTGGSQNFPIDTGGSQEAVTEPTEQSNDLTRADGTKKGEGWLGPIEMTDGSGKTMSEYSIGVEFDGVETEIPTLVPTLTKAEVDHLRSGGKVTDEIERKAIEHAKLMKAQGRNVFKDD